MYKDFVKEINAKIKKYDIFEEMENEIKFIENGTNGFGDKVFDLVLNDALMIKLAYYDNKEFVLENTGKAYSSTYWNTMKYLIKICNNEVYTIQDLKDYMINNINDKEFLENFKVTEEDIYIIIGNEEVIINKWDNMVKSSMNNFNSIHEIVGELINR